MRAVWKFAVLGGTVPYVEPLPAGAKVLHLGQQRGLPHIWVEVEETAAAEDRTFQVIGTGQEIPGGAVYIGTWQEPPFVWHLYEVK